jgi:hypothetical protein
MVGKIFELLGVPHLSQPLAKAIRTSEGIMVWAVNIGITLFTALESAALPHEAAAVIVTVNTGLHVLTRTLLKVFAVQKEIGIEAPEIPAIPASAGAVNPEGKYGGGSEVKPVNPLAPETPAPEVPPVNPGSSV